MRAALIAALFAFAFSQILMGAHAAKYGDGPHDHQGQVCVLALAAPDGGKFVGTASFVFAVALVLWGFAASAPQTAHAPARVRAARQRGPPNL